MQLNALKSDCNLFSRLYVACQTRDGDLDRFFSHENSTTAPSLSQGKELRHGNKSALMDCLDTENQMSTKNAPQVDAKIIDGPTIVHMLKTDIATSFQSYAEEVFAPHILTYLQNTGRVDIIWDVYIAESLKASTRLRRGTGVRRRVAPIAKLPKNWKEFLSVDENKDELFKFLSQRIVDIAAQDGKVLYTTFDDNVLCSMPLTDLSGLMPCRHEEADSRIFVHLADAVSKGYKKVSIRTVDTDVVAIAVAAVSEISVDELWIAFGTGHKFRYIAVHEIAQTLGPQKSAVLPVFHSITGCDTVSSFNGRGKKTAWEVWECFPEVTNAFREIGQTHLITEDSQLLIERFVILMYDRTSELIDINATRKDLFTRKSRALDYIPPTKAALQQHVKRASLQSQGWIRATHLDQKLPNPSDCG